MKVKIGSYRSWFGPYQLARLLRYVGCSEDFTDWLGEKIPAGPFEWFDRTFRNRKIRIKIHDYDTWGMDSTLSLLIVPMLKQLKESKNGSGQVDDDDVPENLRKAAAPAVEHEWDIDDNWHPRWNYALDEMIWAMEQIRTDYVDEPFSHKGFEKEKYEAYHARVRNGCRLFGKYYQNLWD